VSTYKSQPNKENIALPAAEKDFVLSRDPNRALREMMDAIAALQAIYAEENTALAAADTRAFIALQERKIKIVKNYQSAAQQIIARRDEFRSASPAAKHQLQAMQAEFSELAAVNMQALDRIRRSVQRLGARVMRAARESVQKTSVNYGAKGSMNKVDRAVSIGFSESA
jgi:hypothetical protein